jgi:(E)-4-hydroxy-3-methylbut-2-enyl-diphosphate synthase
MDVSVIGCKVNGPGEAKEADIGVVGASPRSLVYRNGEKSHLLIQISWLMKLKQWFVNVFKSLKKLNLKRLFVVHHEFNCRN